MAWRGLDGPTRRQFLVGIRDDKAAGIELGGLGVQIVVVAGETAIARDIKAKDIAAGIAMDHPVGQNLADGTALAEAAHAAASHPIVAQARHRPHQRVAVGGKGEGAVHPFADADVAQAWEPLEPDRQFGHDPVRIGRQKVHAIVPWRAPGHPVAGVAFIDPQKHALAFGLHVGEALKVGDAGDLAVETGQFGDVPGHQIMMLHRRDGQVDPHHPAHLARPKARRVDHMLGGDLALFGHQPPAVRAGVQLDHAVAQDNLGATVPRCDGKGMGRAMRVDVAFLMVVQPADDAGRIDNGAQAADFIGADQAGVHSHHVKA